MRRRTKIVLRVIIVCVIGVFVGAIYMGWRAYQAFMAEERQLLALTFVSEATQNYIDAHKAWPRSWADLETTWPPRGLIEMPRDEAMVKSLVAVDFTADLKDIASQTPRTFHAVALRGRDAGDYGIAGILKAARECQPASNPTTTPAPANPAQPN